ncbi:MAG: SPOR domain-containing protein [Desulfovibrionaceae bacterium]|jgi:hypothetical protein
MWRAFLMALCLTGLTVALVGCGDEKVYDWQRPHDTYLVGSFSDSRQADALRSKLQRSGYAPRIETGIQNGTFMLNVLVDVYTMTPNTLPELEKISGKPPVLRKSSTDTPKVSPKAP